METLRIVTWRWEYLQKMKNCEQKIMELILKNDLIRQHSQPNFPFQHHRLKQKVLSYIMLDVTKNL